MVATQFEAIPGFRGCEAIDDHLTIKQQTFVYCAIIKDIWLPIRSFER
jgi:hypothetical protein